jgi:hypothetical protein
MPLPRRILAFTKVHGGYGMSDIAIQNAVAARDEGLEKIAEAEALIKEWRAKVARAERFIADWQEFSGQVAPAAPTLSASESGGDTTTAKASNPKKEEVAEAALEILSERGVPMSRDDLLSALSLKGIHIHGKDPLVVLQTMLWRMRERIVHLKGFGYWPKDVTYAPAAYDPAALSEIASAVASDLSDLLSSDS